MKLVVTILLKIHMKDLENFNLALNFLDQFILINLSKSSQLFSKISPTETFFKPIQFDSHIATFHLFDKFLENFKKLATLLKNTFIYNLPLTCFI